MQERVGGSPYSIRLLSGISDRQVVFTGVDSGFRPVAGSRLVEDICQMVANCLFAYEKPVSDLLVC